MSKPKMGRPKLPKREVKLPFVLRLSPGERKQIETAAKKVDLKPGKWARETLLNASKIGS
jgi:hypothetical protein